MVQPVFVLDLDEIRELQGWENWQIDYSIEKGTTIKCNYIVSLYGLCLYLFKKITKIHYEQIENMHLEIGTDKMKQAVTFMNRVSYNFLNWAQFDLESESILNYMKKQFHNDEIKMILKFQEDIVEGTNNSKNYMNNQAVYVLVYLYSEDMFCKINEFSLQKFCISSDEIKNKLSMLGLGVDQQLQSLKIYGLKKNEEQVFTEIKLLPQQLNNDNNNQHDSDSFSKYEESQSVYCHFLFVYGHFRSVNLFMSRLQRELSAIKVKILTKRDKLYHSYIFKIVKALAEKYNKCKTIENNSTITIYYHESIQQFLDQQLMGYQEYHSIKTNSIKQVLKEPSVMSLRNKLTNVITYDDSVNGEQLVSTNEVISCIQKIANKKQKESIYQKKDQSMNKMQNNKQSAGKQSNYSIEFMNNIQINEENYKQLIQITGMIKVQEYLTFKIDVGQHIRITNRISKAKLVYLIFKSYAEILQLQTVIEESISMRQLEKIIKQYQNECFYKPKIITSEDGNLILKLYPATEAMWVSKQKYYQSLIREMKEQKNIIFRYILCTIHTFRQILSVVIIDFMLFFVLNQQVPAFQFDQLFQKQTSKLRTLIGRNSNYCQGKVQICNKEFKSQQNYHKDLDAVKEIMSKNIHQYEIGDFTLSEVDEHSISFMIAEGFKNIYLVLSKKPKAEYIYLTYHQKVMKVIRDQSGTFKSFVPASMNTDILTNNQISMTIKSVIHRAFLTGQKYLSINLPFEHVKLVSLDNITRLQIQNHSLVRYYLKKINTSERYKVTLKAPFTSQYFQTKFSKNYKLKFDCSQLKKQIKSLEFGYGNIKKERQRPFVCLTAPCYLCEKFLIKVQSQYENRSKNFRK